MFEIDDLTVWIGEPYVINDKIAVTQPKIRDILTFGEKDYFNVIQTLCSTSSNLKSRLADMGVDWEKVEDFQMFIMLAPSLNVEKTHQKREESFNFLLLKKLLYSSIITKFLK